MSNNIPKCRKKASHTTNTRDLYDTKKSIGIGGSSGGGTREGGCGETIYIETQEAKPKKKIPDPKQISHDLICDILPIRVV